ncbi:histidine triad nucleotide-binding protein [Patescibacteria group bacterium]|nr:histidine triad nucleotide-binding protein [Patescibacteria group bacterium]
MSCVFCQIIKKELPSETVFEDDNLIVFKDIKPSAPIDLLVVSKKHIKSLIVMEKQDNSLLKEMVWQAKLLAVKFGLDQSGYRILFNCGRGGGQIIDHLHLHLMGGWEKTPASNII